MTLPVRKPHARTSPQPDCTPMPVCVTTTAREALNDGVDWVQPDARTVAHIDAHLPGKPSANLRAVRAARVLSQEAAFLNDTTGKVPPPDAIDLVAALQFAAEVLRDGIVIRKTP
jgi:hypothetical protein